jgi:4-methyl-5(b-hydroxyethyl)-thiazole monophosphate biosynthesis
MSKALVFLAPGFEEIETSTIVDVLRRSGVEVTLAGLEPGAIEGGHGMKFVPDSSIDKINAKDFDAVICPGGGLGAKNLRKDNRVLTIIREAFEAGKIVAAICAGPSVLSEAGVLRSRSSTIFPGMENELVKGGGKPQTDLVVEDGNVITSQGPATALLFALKLAERLAGKKAAENVREKTLTNMLLNKVC